MLLLMALGCGEKEGVDSTPSDTNPTDDSATTDDTSTDDTGEEVSDDAPKITTCDAFCYLHETGDTFYNWRVECNVDDAQGVSNVWNGTVDIAKGSDPVANDLMACDATGYCSGTFREDLYGILCSDASSYDFLIKIQDWDQNWSKPYKVAGRQQ